MRDIRPDLKERLTEIEAQRAHHQKQLEVLIERAGTLGALLFLEETRWAIQQAPLAGLETGKPKNHHTPLGRFLLETLVRGSKSLETLKAEVEENGILSTSKHPGRALHFALVGLAHAGYVEKDKVSKIWKLKT